MNATAYFIQDRAQTLSFEGIQYPNTKKTALAWLRRAMAWATQNGLTELSENLGKAVSRVKQEADHVPA